MLYYVYILFSLSLYLQSPSLALQVTATIAKDSKYDYDVLSCEQNWTDHCLCRNEYVESRVQTCLLVNNPQYTYRLHTSPFEIYSTERLNKTSIPK